MTTEMIVRPAQALPLYSIADEAKQLKELALDGAALIGKVTNGDENEKAANAQREIKRVQNLFEKDRKALKEPLLEAGRRLDSLVAKEVQDLDAEFGRLSALVAEFQLAEQRRVNEERRLQQAELDRIEREKQAALAAATTEKEKAQIVEVAAAKTYVESQPIQATRTEGQVIKTDWDIEMVNPYDLARLHPDCVEIKPRLSVIKMHLNAGRELHGIKAKQITVATVRTSPLRTAIEV